MNLVITVPAVLRRCFKYSKYKRPESKVKECPWPLVLTNLHELIQKNMHSNCKPKSLELSMKSYVPAFSHI